MSKECSELWWAWKNLILALPDLCFVVDSNGSEMIEVIEVKDLRAKMREVLTEFRALMKAKDKNVPPVDSPGFWDRDLEQKKG